MEFVKAFPIAIIDEDYEGKNAAGRGMQQLAAAIEKEGFRVVAGLSYEDARRLVNVFNFEVLLADLRRWRRSEARPVENFGRSAGREAQPQRQAADLPVRRRAHRRGCARQRAEARNAFMRLFEDSAEFMARAIVRAAQLYLQRLPPPMFKALMEYTLQASYSWHTPGHGGGTAFRRVPVGDALL